MSMWTTTQLRNKERRKTLKTRTAHAQASNEDAGALTRTYTNRTSVEYETRRLATLAAYIHTYVHMRVFTYIRALTQKALSFTLLPVSSLVFL